VLADLLQVAPARKAFHPALQHQQADVAVAVLVPALPGLRRHDHHVRVDAVGDERLGPVDHVVLPIAPGARGQRRQVRADPRLGHRDRGYQLARGDAAQPALALGLGAVGQEVRKADVGVHRHTQSHAAHAGMLCLFADHQVEAEVLGARAAMALGHRHAEEAPAARQRE
jgi:hypothetical protein